MSEIKYCVTAFIDLLGFASHLEIGADLRTNIGEQAIDRLNSLHNVIKFVEKEKMDCPEHYPEIFDIKRINDALVLTLDLPDILKPEVGQARRNAIHEKYFQKILQEAENTEQGNEDGFENLERAYIQALKDNTKELFLFCGIVSRIFNYVKARESQMMFPGPKGVVCTGYRKIYTTPDGSSDYLSANFAFSNSYIAESKLKGTGSSLFFDNNILQLLALDNISKNFLRYSLFIPTEGNFNPALDYNDPLSIPFDREMKKEVEIELFRKKYIFREINPKLMAFFQILNYLEPHIKGVKPIKSLKLFEKILPSLSEPKTVKEIKEKPIQLFNLLNTDIGQDIRKVRDLLVEKDSSFMQQNDGSELLKKIIIGVQI